jgi:hypothetical protein
MNNFVHDMLHDSPPARRIMALYEEYEAQETAEAHFVKGALTFSRHALVITQLGRPRPVRDGTAR